MSNVLQLSRADMRVAQALLDVATGNAFSRKRDLDALDRLATEALGFTLPADWTGRAVIVQVSDGAEVYAETYTRRAKAEEDGEAYVLLASKLGRNDAQSLADRLALIDAHSQLDPAVKAAKLARITEEQVRRAPSSSEEEIWAAKEDRKLAEFNAMQSGPVGQRPRDSDTTPAGFVLAFPGASEAEASELLATLRSGGNTVFMVPAEAAEPLLQQAIELMRVDADGVGPVAAH